MLSVAIAVFLAPFASQAHAADVASPEGLLGLPNPHARIVISDLRVTLGMPSGTHTSHVLGLDATGTVIVWATDTAGASSILRFQPTDGTLLSQVHLQIQTMGMAPDKHDIALVPRTDEVLVLNAERMHLLSLHGDLLDTIELPFAPWSIIDAPDDSVVILAGWREDGASPVHRLVRTTGQFEPAAAQSTPLGASTEQRLQRRLGVATSSGDVWTVTEATYHLELWSSRSLAKVRGLAPHPAVLDYLLAPYKALRIVSTHLVADRYLWVFLRAENRYPGPSGDGSERSRFESTYDGFVEVVDLEDSTVVASRFLPDLDLGGWVAGPIGYRRTAQGGIELVHCAVEYGSEVRR